MATKTFHAGNMSFEIDECNNIKIKYPNDTSKLSALQEANKFQEDNLAAISARLKPLQSEHFINQAIKQKIAYEIHNLSR